MRIRSDLRKYQRAAAKFIREKKRCALFVDMGLGKTASSLTAIADLAAEMEIGKVIVVAPLRVAKKVWTDEAMEWTHTRGLVFSRVLGTPEKRIAALERPADIYLITTDLVEWLLKHYEGKDFPFDGMFIDESSKYKHADSKRSKAMRILVRDLKYVVLLTGTPSSNGLHDLWAQVYLIDRGARLGHTLKDFRKRYFHPNIDGQGAYRPLSHAHGAIQRKLSDICFTLRSEDYLELPERIDNEIKIELDQKTYAKYKKFERDYILEMAETEIKAVSAGALYQKLLQLANGVVYDAEKNEVPFHTQKVDELREIVEAANGEPILVAYNFQSDITAIKKAFPEAQVLRHKMQLIDDWNAGKVPMLLAHPQSAGHGLNLQFGGGIIVWYGLTWNLENYLQFNKRVHRHGQTRANVVIHHLLAKGTIDETVMKALHRKDKDQNALLDALKEHVRDFLANA